MKTPHHYRPLSGQKMKIEYGLFVTIVQMILAQTSQYATLKKPMERHRWR